MSEESVHVFCGNAKLLTFAEGRIGFKINIDLDQLKKAIEENPDCKNDWTGKDGAEHHCVKLESFPLREPTEYRTHYVKVDTWKPDPSANSGGGGMPF